MGPSQAAKGRPWRQASSRSSCLGRGGQGRSSGVDTQPPWMAPFTTTPSQSTFYECRKRGRRFKKKNACESPLSPPPTPHPRAHFLLFLRSLSPGPVSLASPRGSVANVSSEGVPARGREGQKFGESQGGGRIFHSRSGDKDARKAEAPRE